MLFRPFTLLLFAAEAQPPAGDGFFEIARIPPEAAKQPPTILVKWYDWLRWLLDRVDSFPKNQRLILGTRLADRAIGITADRAFFEPPFRYGRIHR